MQVSDGGESCESNTHLSLLLPPSPFYNNNLLTYMSSSPSSSVFGAIGDRPFAYDDLDGLVYMSKCINETLRKWPVVPNGMYIHRHDMVLLMLLHTCFYIHGFT